MRRKAILITGYHWNHEMEIIENAPKGVTQKEHIEFTLERTMNSIHKILNSDIGGQWINEIEIARYNATAKKEDILLKIGLEKCDFILVYFMGHAGSTSDGDTEIGLSLIQNEKFYLSEIKEKINSDRSLIVIDGCREYPSSESNNFCKDGKVYNAPEIDNNEFEILLPRIINAKKVYNDRILSSSKCHKIVFSTQLSSIAILNPILGHFFSVLLINTVVEWARNEKSSDTLRFEEALELVKKKLLDYPQESSYCQVPDWEKEIEFPLAIK